MEAVAVKVGQEDMERQKAEEMKEWKSDRKGLQEFR